MKDGEIIDALGGTSALAAAISADHRVVSNWRKRGISPVGRYKVRDAAKKAKLALPPDFMTRKPTP